MKKNQIPAIILLIIGIALLGYFTPWWVPPFWVVFIAAFMKLEIKNGLMLGGICFTLVWVVMALYMTEQDTSGLIAKTGTILGGLSHQAMFMVVLVISFITGALAGWLGSVSGTLIRAQLKQSKAN